MECPLGASTAARSSSVASSEAGFGSGLKSGLRHGGFLTPVKCHLSHAVEMVHLGFLWLKAQKHGTIFEGKSDAHLP